MDYSEGEASGGTTKEKINTIYFKADKTDISISTRYQMTVCNVEAVTCSDESTENDHLKIYST